MEMKIKDNRRFSDKVGNPTNFEKSGKMDRRIEKTKESIRAAFVELRAKKALERITVKELCGLARINKSTFYAHYKDIYDLSEQIESEIISDIIAGISIENVFSNTSEFTKSLFLAYSEKNSLITSIFSGSRQEQLPKRMHAAVRELFFSKNPQYADDLGKNVMLTFSVYGSYYAFSENREMGENAVIDVIGGISESLFR